ncbi:alcohol dehydrogenase [Priestia megaterium]|uniref:Alcohol dehydrogenase n=1 Tax=Priestia megaterium TaxID=1404 RepID=A0A3D8WX10_PRIMG|nr:medium chain dehydrogenase/reductase family protein [Priestia megaterium]MDH3171402.1 medium chain dehydrogenase/reductase family protein [Priestia megaterium]MED4287337.1 medium chain dehydrogenase/reductase family protein [Priestia megaterium]RDZ11096.1 alcohol dehydrogenase [Priestia megaterium]
MLNIRVIVTRYGGPQVIDVIEEPLRKPEKGEIRVKVQATGVALADIMRREGKIPMSPIPPFTPGYDVIGIVDELGEDVQKYSVGDKVAVFFNGTGGYAAYVYAKEDEIVAAPAHIDAVKAVAVILNYVTAYQMLHRIAKVSEGERILIHGASGGVGTALLELGKLAKLEMYGTASLAKHHIVSQYGAMPIDYRNEDFVDVLRLRAPEGMDVVFDPIGGRNYERSMKTLSKNGRFIGYGYTSILQQGDPEDWAKDWENLAKKQTTEKGNSVYLYAISSLKKERLDWFQEDVRFLLSLLEEGKINPLISHRIPLREAAQAQELLGKSLSVGKVVLICE